MSSGIRTISAEISDDLRSVILADIRKSGTRTRRKQSIIRHALCGDTFSEEYLVDAAYQATHIALAYTKPNGPRGDHPHVVVGVALFRVRQSDTFLQAVCTKQRRQGVGRALVECVQVYAKESQHTRITLRAGPESVGFFRALGFKTRARNRQRQPHDHTSITMCKSV